MFTPTPVPDNAPSALKAWLADAMRAIASDLSAPQPLSVTLAVLGNEPTRVRNGTIVYADGAEWDPGSGEGFYGYENGAWVKL